MNLQQKIFLIGVIYFVSCILVGVFIDPLTGVLMAGIPIVLSGLIFIVIGIVIIFQQLGDD